MTLAGIFLVVGMRATLPARKLGAFFGKGHALWGDGTWSAHAVGFSNDFIAHMNLPSLANPTIVTHSLASMSSQAAALPLDQLERQS